jgi:hypothetical protein
VWEYWQHWVDKRRQDKVWYHVPRIDVVNTSSTWNNLSRTFRVSSKLPSRQLAFDKGIKLWKISYVFCHIIFHSYPSILDADTQFRTHNTSLSAKYIDQSPWLANSCLAKKKIPSPPFNATRMFIAVLTSSLSLWHGGSSPQFADEGTVFKHGTVKYSCPYVLTEHDAMKACWGSRDIAPRILDIDTRWRWVVNFTLRPLYLQGNSPWFPFDRRLGVT